MCGDPFPTTGDPSKHPSGDIRDAGPVEPVRGESARFAPASTPLRRYVSGEIWPGGQTSARAHAEAACRGFFHPIGTCALGFVADPDGRVRGLDRVFVADASFVPELPRANTNLTVAAVAERLAATIPTAS